MKKITRKMKGKKVLSFVLAAIMLATTFNMALPMLKLDANAATTIGGVTQERVVGTDGSYVTTYDNYAAMYLNGASNPTNIVIPGLNPSQDYVIQGMTYYPKRDWMLVTAYHNDATESSKVFALDAATGEFVAMFSFLNVDGSVNMDHGGGIAVSEHNIYYSCGDKDRKIAYAPLSALENASLNSHTQIQLVAEADFAEVGSVDHDSKTAYTAYVCYDEGVLWLGNFYDVGASLIGITIAANEYNAPANSAYNSMVFGYKLNGSSSQEEWNYLVGNVTGKDCCGNPSYAIGLNNALKDVQYAVVDNGKLYLSRSYGSGAGNSINFGFGETSFLSVADIDLSQPGTRDITIRTNTGATKPIKAYDIQKYDNFAMPPMSEGLCVVNDNIFITFEGASNKYLNESSGLTSIGNCEKPIDVIWQLDPYELMETTVAEPEKSIYYEKVNNLSQIVDGEEYIIVHESKTADSFSQKNYLYALNAEGNLKDMPLSKSSNDANAIKGYDAMIGHPISYYSFEKTADGKDILYLSKPEEDDIDNVRWTISKTGTDRYSIKNTSTYFANYGNLYFTQNKITMSPSGSDYLSNMAIEQFVEDSGYFYFSNNKQYYLWCNDGNANYNAKANAYYANNAAAYPLLDGVTEVAGTFHCDAMNSSGANILGAAIDTSDDDPNISYEDGAFQIYRRVVDETSSTYESRVYTDLKAKLQADGTYNVTLETYAISPNHYQYVGERPTDYIIVADTSSSMGQSGSTGIKEYDASYTLAVSSMSLEDNTKDDNGKGNADVVIGYAYSNPEEDIYFKHSDGKYYKAYMAIRNKFKGCGNNTFDMQYYYVYYIADDGYYYCYTNQESSPSLKYNEEQFKAWVAGGDGQALQTASSSETTNTKRRKEALFTGYHYRFDDVNSPYTSEHNRLDTLRTTVGDLVDDIAAQNSNNRIAFVKYGNGTSYLGPNGWASSGFTDAFWSASSGASTIKAQLPNISAGAQSDNSGMELQLANSIISNSGTNYKADGTRNLAIIFFTDGIPGADGGSSVTAAANAVIGKALEAKNNGAFIYSVLIGNNEVSGFNKKTYIDAVSSKYAAAESLTAIGGQSVDGINYSLSLATTSINNFVNFGEITIEEAKQNASVGLDNLDANSYLREQLSNAFKFPEDGDYKVAVDLITGSFDEVGRFSFKETEADINANAADAAKISATTDTASKTITITNYHYGDEYIAKNRQTPGRKLRVTITGLLADETATIQNTSINNTETTGIFKTKGNMDNNVAFKYLPTEYFNIPKYTYVLDYGLQLLDTDVNGTLKAVSEGLKKQDVNNYIRESENGLVAISGDSLDLLYHTTPTNTTDSGYVLIQRDDGKYDWFEIEIVPASNVYFEETEFDTTAGTGTVAWSTATGGTSVSYRELPGETDVDGYDEAYNNSNTYSNGKTLSATVDANNKRSKTATVDFAGDGIDIISACGPTTGLQLINIKDSSGTSVKASIVDTYYADDSFSQVPIFSFRGANGTYTVETTALYLTTSGAVIAGGRSKSGIKNNLIDTGLVMNSSDNLNTAEVQAMLDAAGVEDVDAENLELVWFDDNSVLNGGTGVAPTKKGTRAETSTVTLNNYIDGFRIYNPLGASSENYSEGENNASYVNVIKNLAPVGNGIDSLDGIGFVTGSLADGEKLSFSNYESVGPTDELYLLGGKAITFKANVNVGEKVMLGLRAVKGATTLKITSNKSDKSVEVTVNSATEMYYDITNCIGDITADGTEVQIIVQNTGSNMLAVNQIKFSGGDKVNSGNTPVTRSLARTGNAAAPVDANVFLPLTEADLFEVENGLTVKETVQGIVKNGVILPAVEDAPEDTTTPDAGDDTTNDDTNTDSGEDASGITSLIEYLVSFITKLISSLFSMF